MTKILSVSRAAGFGKAMKKLGKTVIFTNGCFDILHEGHVLLLKKAKGFGDVLVVGLNSDSSVKKIKGRGRPVNDQRGRLAVLSAIEYVDKIIVFGGETPRELVKKLRPDILVKGADYAASEIAGAEFAGRVKRIRLKKGRSTTAVMRKIARIVC